MKTFLILAFLPVSLLAQNLEPGLWRSESQFKLNGLPLPTKDETNCITAKEIKNPKQTVEEALKKNDCVLTKWDMKKNQVTAAVKCKSDKFEANGTITGTFEPKSYKLTGEATGHHDVIGEGKAQIDLFGEWTGACKDAEKKKSKKK